MTDNTPVGSPMFSVDRTARLMLVCARQDPALLSRSSNQQADENRDPVWDVPALFHWHANLSRPDEGFSGELYLEELVSIASEAAERAGDASRRAADATVALRHSRLAFAVIGALGMAIGVAAAAGAIWSGEARQSRVAGDLTAVQSLQHRADQQLVALVAAQNHPLPPVQTAAVAPPTAAVAPQTAAVSPPTADTAPQSADTPPQTADAAPQSGDPALQTVAVSPRSAPIAPQPVAIAVSSRLQPITVSSRQEWSASPVEMPRSAAHAPATPPPAPAWAHRHRHPVRRVYRYYYPTGPRPPVILVRVVQNIQRDVGSLFR
jgi:cytoskeletal protein RodZ